MHRMILNETSKNDIPYEVYSDVKANPTLPTYRMG